MTTFLKIVKLYLKIKEAKKRLKKVPLNSLQRPIYVFNSVVNTKLPVILSHQRSTTVSLETYRL